MAKVIGSADLAGDPGLQDPHLGRDLGDLAGPLRDRAHLERVAGDRGDRAADPLFGHGDLEEPAAELFVGHVSAGSAG